MASPVWVVNLQPIYSFALSIILVLYTHRFQFYIKNAKPRVSLTGPNRDHFAQVSLMVLDNFLDTIAKAKELICKSVAQNLKRVSLTKSLLPVAMTFILLLSNPT